jgi:hypothetical protein
MFDLKRTGMLSTALAVVAAGQARAQVSVPPSYATVTFSTSNQVMTIAPNGGIETLAGNGITIDVYLMDSNGNALEGVPRQEIVLYNVELCLCPGGNFADRATDSAGHTTFTGRIYGGGCISSSTAALAVYADGVFINNLPVKINSPDHLPASPCYVDAADVSALAGVLGIPAQYHICYDYNESGPPTINASDLSYFASLLGTGCP